MSSTDPNKPLVHDPRDKWQFYRHDALGREGCKYITRRIIDLGPLGSIRLHHWLHDDMHWYNPVTGKVDADPTRNTEWAAHNHPWGFLTLMLWGSYTDINFSEFLSIKTEDHLHPGSIRWRPANWTHGVRTTGAWTLLWTTPKQQNFGFWVKTMRGMKFLRANKFFGRAGMPPCS